MDTDTIGYIIYIRQLQADSMLCVDLFYGRISLLNNLNLPFATIIIIHTRTYTWRWRATEKEISKIIVATCTNQKDQQWMLARTNTISYRTAYNGQCLFNYCGSIANVRESTFIIKKIHDGKKTQSVQRIRKWKFFIQRGNMNCFSLCASKYPHQIRRAYWGEMSNIDEKNKLKGRKKVN